MASDGTTPETQTESAKAAFQVMQTHVDGLNARDEDLLASSLHFPHYRLADGAMKTWENRDSYLADFQKRAGEEWGYTRWGELEILMESDDKVHLKARVERYRADDSPLVSFHSLWVIAKLDGVWAAQLRSSFGSA